MSKGGRQRIQIEGINLEIHSIYKLAMFYIYFKYEYFKYACHSYSLNLKRHILAFALHQTYHVVLNLKIIPG